MFLSIPFGFGGAGVSAEGLPSGINGAITDFSPPYAESFVRVTVQSDGQIKVDETVQGGGTLTRYYNWHPTASGIGAYYWLRITRTQGDPTNLGVPPGATLRQLSSDVMIGLTNNANPNGLHRSDLRFEWFSNAAGSGGPLAVWNTWLEVETAI
jgi:hypothetical protein